MCWGSFNNVSDLISDFVACNQVEQRVNFVLNDTMTSFLWTEGFDSAQQSCSFTEPMQEQHVRTPFGCLHF